MKDSRGMVSVDVDLGGEGAEGVIEKATPWVSSFLMHAGLGLVGAFVVYAAMSPRAAVEKNVEPLGVIELQTTEKPLPPGLVDDALLKENVVKSTQDLLKNDASGADAFGVKGSTAKTLAGMGVLEPTDVPLIAPGTGGSMGPGNGITIGEGPGSLAANGPLVVGGPVGSVLPRTRAMKTVYILDHSGSMLDSYDYLREEVKRATQGLNGAQRFSVVMVSEEAEFLGAEGLRRASPEVKREVAKEIGLTRAQGQNDGVLDPFKHGFEKALAMKPDVIIFLTDGNFDPRLVEAVKGMNKADASGHRAQIYTIAYVQITPDAAEDLKKIAADGGGKYKFVSEKDLQR